MFITLRGEVLPTAQATVSFKWAELACKCGCRTAYVEEEALEKLQQLRDFLGKPITINSASRCPIHNAKLEAHLKVNTGQLKQVLLLHLIFC
jgi:hypothetical protein